MCNTPIELFKRNQKKGYETEYQTANLSSHLKTCHPTEDTAQNLLQNDRKRKTDETMLMMSAGERFSKWASAGGRLYARMNEDKGKKNLSQATIPFTASRKYQEDVYCALALWLTYAKTTLPKNVCEEEYFKFVLKVVSRSEDIQTLTHYKYEDWLDAEFEIFQILERMYLRECFTKVCVLVCVSMRVCIVVILLAP